jgi:hypothetical protein
MYQMLTTVIDKKTLGVDDAYALETPEDGVRLNGKWAPSYDSDFVGRTGYILFELVAEQLATDRTTSVKIADDQYDGLISAGTFTHGHLGPGPLDELWRVARPGAHCAISVRSTHCEAAGFAVKLSTDVRAGRITEPKVVEVDLYSEKASNPEHANDKAFIVVCQVV